MPGMTLSQLFLNYLVQGCVLGLAALALLALAPRLLRRYAPQWFCRVWAVLGVLLLLPLGSLPLWRQRAPVQLHTPTAWVQPVEVPAGIDLPRPQEEPDTPHQPAESRTALPESHPAPPSLPDPLTLLAGVWLAGAAGFVLWQGAAYLVWRRRALRLSRPGSGPWAEAWADACKEVPLPRPVPLRLTPAVSSPVTAGLLRPVVLVPEQAPSTEAARMMLLHERTHLRRHDLALKALLLAVRALHWYNPAVILLARRADRDMEAACDAQVVAGHDPRWRGTYGEALLAAVRMGRAPALTTGFALSKKALKFRFARLWDAAPRRRGRLALAAVGLCAALGVGLIACTPAPNTVQDTGLTPVPETSSAAPQTPAPATAAPVTDHSGKVQRDPALLSTTRSQLTAPLPGELESVSHDLYCGTQLGDRVDLAMADGEGGVSFWHSEDNGATYTAETLNLTAFLGDGPFRVANYEQLTPDTGFLVIARESEAAPGYMTDKDLCFLRQTVGDWQLMSEQACPADTDLGGWHTQPFYWMNENVGFWAPHTDYHGIALWRTVDGGASWEKMDLSGLESLIPYEEIPGIHTCWAGTDDLNPAPGSLRVHCNAVDTNNTRTRTFWLISDDYGETWRVRGAYTPESGQAAPGWLTRATPLPEEDEALAEELYTRLQDCLYLNRCTTGEPVLLAWEKTGSGWQPAAPGTPGTLEGVYAKAAEGLTADSVRAGLNCTLTDAARQSLFPGWDGPLPMLAEVDGQLYIRCERAADLSGDGWWMDAGFRYGGGNGNGNGNGNGYGNGTGNGRTRRLRLWQDGGSCCMDLHLRQENGCWLLDSAEETQNLPEACPLCGGPLENRAVDTQEGGLEKQPCIHEAYGEDYIFPEYTVYQCVCTQCGQWQSDTWQEANGQQRMVCHGYQ